MLKIVNPKYTTYKIMASWYGGYTGSDSWKLSSGTVSQNDTDNGREYVQDSGSIYLVSEHNYGMSSYTQSVYNTFNVKEHIPEGVSITLLTPEEAWTLDPSVFGAWNS